MTEMTPAVAIVNPPGVRNAIVEANLGLAFMVAKRYRGRGLDVEDLAQIALLSMLRSAETFDASRGSFSGYCVSMASRAVHRAVKAHQNRPRGIGSHGDEDDPTATVPAREEPAAEDVSGLRSLLGVLDARERRFLSLHYGLAGEEPRTLHRIGVMHGLSTSRVTQIVRGALDKMRVPPRFLRKYAVRTAWVLVTGP